MEETLNKIYYIALDVLALEKERLQVERARLSIEQSRLSIEELRLRSETQRAEVYIESDKKAAEVAQKHLELDTLREERAKAIDDRNAKLFGALQDIMPGLLSYYQRTFAEPVTFRFEDLNEEQIKEMAEKLGVKPEELEQALSELPPGVYPPGFGPESFRSQPIPAVDDPERVCVNKKCQHFRQAHLQGEANCLMGGCNCEKFEPGGEVGNAKAPDDFLEAAGLKK